MSAQREGSSDNPLCVLARSRSCCRRGGRCGACASACIWAHERLDVGADLGAHGVKRMGGAHKERTPIRLAPVQIGYQLRHSDFADQRARARIDPDTAWRCHPHIPGAVTFHAVGHARLQFGADAGGENAVGAQRPVRVHVKNPDQRPHRVVDIELPLVRGKAKSVRLLEQIAVDQKLGLSALWRHAIDALESELPGPLDAIDRHAAVPWIGEIDRAVGANADIVGAVELLAVVVRGENFTAPVEFADETGRGMLADYEA